MNAGDWPELRLGEWADTKDTLHLWMQIVGKVRLGLMPWTNHGWHVALYATARGLTTSSMPYDGMNVELSFDFIDHVLRLETSRGQVDEVELRPRSVADFFRAVRAALSDAGVRVHIWTRPQEIADVIPFDRDETHGTYDPEAAHGFWLALSRAASVLQEFRARFIGKCSPVHFWWGGFDLSCTRFSGRRAPEHPGGIPNLADWVTREAYSHECISAGWWPGGEPIGDAAFYAYAYPEPDGCRVARINPSAAGYHEAMREWILPYDAVRRSSAPEDMALAFFQSTYETAANLGGWDRASLEADLPDAARRVSLRG